MSRVFGFFVFCVAAVIVIALYFTVGIAMVLVWAMWMALDHDGRCMGCEDCLGEVAIGGSSQVNLVSSCEVVDYPASMAA